MHFWKTISPLKTNWGIVLEIGNDRVPNVNMWVGSHTALVSLRYRRSSHDLQARSQDRDTPPSLESSTPHRLPCSLRSVLSLGLSRGRWAFFSSRSASMLLPFWSASASCVRRQGKCEQRRTRRRSLPRNILNTRTENTLDSEHILFSIIMPLPYFQFIFLINLCLQ